MSTKLITEFVEGASSIIVEEQGTKKLYIQGPFMQANVKNRNGRIYPTEVLDKQAHRYINEMVKTGSAMGELNHPQRPNVDPREASHLVTELWKDGDNWMGKAKVLTHVPVGQIVEGLLLDGVRLGVSSRGVGSIRENSQGIPEVQNDYYLSAIDVVSNPSGPDCFVNGIMEGVDWIWNNSGFKPIQLEAAKEHIEQSVRSRELNEAKLLSIFETMLNSLSK